MKVDVDGFHVSTTAASGGIVIVKTSRLLVVALYTEPATAAEAIPLVHRFVDDQLANLLGAA